ncbi:MAG: GNAT family N-acetyltransferase [Paracoccaceae bacterium]
MNNRDIQEPVEGWVAPGLPDGAPMQGRFVRLERLHAPSHASAIHSANLLDAAIWDYLPYGPFLQLAGYVDWVQGVQRADDPLFYAIFDQDRGDWAGVASFLRPSLPSGSIEVGHINLAAPLQQSRAATEAMYLMMKWVFEAGYRRYEWKCNAANLRSRRAAQRLGFSFEGVFRQHMIVKNRNRDTAWFAIIDKEWPKARLAFETWLAPENFDGKGRQITALSRLTAPIRATSDPALDKDSL